MRGYRKLSTLPPRKDGMVQGIQFRIPSQPQMTIAGITAAPYRELGVLAFQQAAEMQIKFFKRMKNKVLDDHMLGGHRFSKSVRKITDLKQSGISRLQEDIYHRRTLSVDLISWLEREKDALAAAARYSLRGQDRMETIENKIKLATSLYITSETAANTTVAKVDACATEMIETGELDRQAYDEAFHSQMEEIKAEILMLEDTAENTMAGYSWIQNVSRRARTNDFVPMTSEDVLSKAEAIGYVLPPAADPVYYENMVPESGCMEWDDFYHSNGYFNFFLGPPIAELKRKARRYLRNQGLKDYKANDFVNSLRLYRFTTIRDNPWSEFPPGVKFDLELIKPVLIDLDRLAFLSEIFVKQQTDFVRRRSGVAPVSAMPTESHQGQPPDLADSEMPNSAAFPATFAQELSPAAAAPATSAVTVPAASVVPELATAVPAISLPVPAKPRKRKRTTSRYMSYEERQAKKYKKSLD